jgi:hypothetical protein
VPFPDPVPPNVLRQAAIALLHEEMGKHADAFAVSADAGGKVIVSGTVASAEERLEVSESLQKLARCNCVVNQLTVRGESTARKGGLPPVRVASAGPAPAPLPPARAEGPRAAPIPRIPERGAEVALTPPPDLTRPPARPSPAASPAPVRIVEAPRSGFAGTGPTEPVRRESSPYAAQRKESSVPAPTPLALLPVIPAPVLGESAKAAPASAAPLTYQLYAGDPPAKTPAPAPTLGKAEPAKPAPTGVSPASFQPSGNDTARPAVALKPVPTAPAPGKESPTPAAPPAKVALRDNGWATTGAVTFDEEPATRPAKSPGRPPVNPEALRQKVESICGKTARGVEVNPQLDGTCRITFHVRSVQDQHRVEGKILELPEVMGGQALLSIVVDP